MAQVVNEFAGGRPFGITGAGRTPLPEGQLSLDSGDIRLEANAMTSFEEFRTTSHKLLIELDAATTKMMMLVSAKEVSGPFWDDATLRHHDAVEAWHAFLNLRTGAEPGPLDV